MARHDMSDTLYLPSPFQLRYFDSVDSTNRLAAEAAREGQNHLVFWAEEQTAGRGRRGRDWVSPRGNLYCSLLIRPDLPATSAMQAGFVAALSLADTVASVLPRSAEVSVKWPNDVLIEGKKTAGILLEAGQAATGGRVDWLVVGTGVNIKTHPETGTNWPATSLNHEGGTGISDEKVLEIYCLRFLAWYVTWKKLGFGPVRQAWLRRAYGLGQPVTVRLGAETLEGVFEAMDEEGALILDQMGVKRRITAGDVFPPHPKEMPEGTA